MRQLYITLKPALKALELTSKTVLGTTLMGNYVSLLPGEGIEFKGYGEYTSDMDSKLIDWRASIRTQTLLIREYVQERNVNVFFLIGTTGSMIYTSNKKLKAEYSGELIASLAYVMMKENDLFGFAMFNKKIHKVALPECSTTQFYRLAEALTKQEYYRGRCDLAKALDFAFKTLKPKTMVFIVSDFLGLEKGWEEALKKASTKFDIVGIMVRDPADFALPQTRSHEILIRSPYSGKMMNIKLDNIREKYKEHVNKHLLYTKKVFLESNADLLILTTEKSFVAPLLNFFMMRKHRRWK